MGRRFILTFFETRAKLAGMEGRSSKEDATHARKQEKCKVDEQFYEIHVALEKHGLKEDIEKILRIYSMMSVRDFPYILNESMLKKFEMAGTLQQYNEIYREVRKAAQMIGDDSLVAWELFSDAELMRQDEIRLEREGSSKAFCVICNCIKAQCVEKMSHFGVFDESPPRLNCHFCTAIFCGPWRFEQRESHQLAAHFTR